MPGDVIGAALARMPSSVAVQAEEVALRIAAGYKVREVGAYLGLTWAEVNALREQTAQAVVAELSESGYSDAETIRLLGIPTAALNGRNP